MAVNSYFTLYLLNYYMQNRFGLVVGFIVASTAFSLVGTHTVSAVGIRPVVTVERAMKIAIEQPDPFGTPSTNAVVVFSRSHVNTQVDGTELAVPFSLTGSAVLVQDYSINLGEKIVRFPANVYEVRVLVRPVVDNLWESGGDTVIFTILPDKSLLNPRYTVGIANKALVFISDWTQGPVMNFTVNGRAETTINWGQPVEINVETDLAGWCLISGGQFAPAGYYLPTPSVLEGLWAGQIYPSRTATYTLLCGSVFPWSWSGQKIVTVHVINNSGSEEFGQ